jgi:hypothetical protein
MPEKEKQRLPTLEEIFEPWELEGRSRCDCVSHRAGCLVPLATLCLWAGAISLISPFCGLFGLILCAFGEGIGLVGLLLFFPFPLLGLALSVAIRNMARRDLDLIFAGKMDHRGYQQTEKARSDSHAAVMLHLLVPVFWLALGVAFFLLYLAASQF